MSADAKMMTVARYPAFSLPRITRVTVSSLSGCISKAGHLTYGVDGIDAIEP